MLRDGQTLARRHLVKEPRQVRLRVVRSDLVHEIRLVVDQFSRQAAPAERRGQASPMRKAVELLPALRAATNGPGRTA